MDITSDLQAVNRRIAEITGAGVPSATAPAAAAPAAGSGPDGLPVLDPAALGATPFADLVRAALAGRQGAAPNADADGIPFAGPGVANGPAPVAPEEIDRLVGANSAAWSVDPALIKAIIANESGFNANAITMTMGGQTLASPSNLSADGKSFSVTWENS